jgi:hypothetical protein
MDNRPPSLERLRTNIADGVVAVWLPVFNHANTLFKVGGKRIWWDRSANPSDHTGPLPWEEAVRCGYYLLDDGGRIKPDIADMLRVIADCQRRALLRALHAPRDPAIAEFLDKLGFRRAVIDHPFSPFVDLDIPLMKQLTQAGIYP